MNDGSIRVPKAAMWTIVGGVIVVVVLAAPTFFVKVLAEEAVEAAMKEHQIAEDKKFAKVEYDYTGLLADIRKTDKEVAVLKEAVKGIAANAETAKTTSAQNQVLIQQVMIKLNVPIPVSLIEK